MTTLLASPTTTAWSLTGVRVLSASGWLDNQTLHLADGVIVEQPGADSQTIDARGLSVMPGLIDLHGDAFERELAPRAGVAIDPALALAANDRSVVAAGITTFYYAITDSFEPGARSRAIARDLIDLLRNGQWACNAMVHIRHEAAATDGHDELIDWLANGRIDLLSLNDHLPPVDNPARTTRYLAGMRRRLAMDDAQAMAFLDQIRAGAADADRQTAELVAAAHAAGVPLASHDDASDAHVDRALDQGVAIGEFPTELAYAKRLRAGGARVVYGAPNLVRGQSHVGAVSVRDVVAADALDAVCSDYHYPSLLRAPFVLAEQGLLELPAAWSLVSAGPAAAVGLGDRKGAIAPGYDADLVLMNPVRGAVDEVIATFVGGRLVYQSHTVPIA